MYVQRDEDGKIIALFQNLQEGYAEEQLADDAAEVAAFQASFVPTTPPVITDPVAKLKIFLAANPDVAKLIS